MTFREKKEESIYILRQMDKTLQQTAHENNFLVLNFIKLLGRSGPSNYP